MRDRFKTQNADIRPRQTMPKDRPPSTGGGIQSGDLKPLIKPYHVLKHENEGYF